jgi:hypothetical protein
MWRRIRRGEQKGGKEWKCWVTRRERWVSSSSERLSVASGVKIAGRTA